MKDMLKIYKNNDFVEINKSIILSEDSLYTLKDRDNKLLEIFENEVKIYNNSSVTLSEKYLNEIREYVGEWEYFFIPFCDIEETLKKDNLFSYSFIIKTKCGVINIKYYKGLKSEIEKVDKYIQDLHNNQSKYFKILLSEGIKDIDMILEGCKVGYTMRESYYFNDLGYYFSLHIVALKEQSILVLQESNIRFDSKGYYKVCHVQNFSEHDILEVDKPRDTRVRINGVETFDDLVNNIDKNSSQTILEFDFSINDELFKEIKEYFELSNNYINKCQNFKCEVENVISDIRKINNIDSILLNFINKKYISSGTNPYFVNSFNLYLHYRICYSQYCCSSDLTFYEAKKFIFELNDEISNILDEFYLGDFSLLLDYVYDCLVNNNVEKDYNKYKHVCIALNVLLNFEIIKNSSKIFNDRFGKYFEDLNSKYESEPDKYYKTFYNHSEMYNSLQEEENRYLLFYYLIDKKVLFMLTEYAFMFPMSLFELGMDAIKLDIETCKVNDNFISDLFENEENKKTYYTLFDIDNMRGIEFENFLSRLFINMGYVSVVTKATQDQGADLLLEKDEEKIVVQAKNYSSNVGNDAIQEVYSALKYYNCKRALVVTNSFFTKQAIDLAIKLDVVLWDRDKLIDLIKEYPVERV